LRNIIGLILFLCSVYATPTWFYNIPSKSYEIIGYGIDKNLQTARDIAKAEISKTIKIKILSNTNITKSIIDGNYNKSNTSKLATSSGATLQGIKILKEEYKDNLWYVSVIYDNRTLLQKINIKYPNYKLSDLKDIQKIKIIRKNSNWYLQIKNNMFLLNTQDFIKLFSNVSNKVIRFTTNQQIYSYPDTMRFTIESKQKGYISILYSEQNGKVGIILDTHKLDKKFTFHNKRDEHQLVVYSPTRHTHTELYICI